MCIFSPYRTIKAKESSENSSSRDIDNAFAMSDEPTSSTQEISLGVANRLLQYLILRGYSIHPHLLSATAIKRLMGIMGLPTYSHAMLVHELCREFRLDSVEYEVLADPAGQPDNVTVKVRIGHVERTATAHNKEIAHKLAAEQMYKYLRTMLKGSRDFDEEDAMFRAYKRCLNEFDEEVAAALEEKLRKDQEQEAAAKRKQAWLGEKHKLSLAVQATILLELEESEDSQESEWGQEPVATSSNVRAPSPTPGPSSAPDQYDNNLIAADGVVNPAAIQLLLRTMEQLGI